MVQVDADAKKRAVFGGVGLIVVVFGLRTCVAVSRHNDRMAALESGGVPPRPTSTALPCAGDRACALESVRGFAQQAEASKRTALVAAARELETALEHDDCPAAEQHARVITREKIDPSSEPALMLAQVGIMTSITGYCTLSGRRPTSVSSASPATPPPMLSARSAKKGGGDLWRMPAGGGDAAALASDLESIHRLVTHGDDLYWTTSRSKDDAGGIWRMPKRGGTPERIATDCLPTALTVDDTGIFWASGGCDPEPKPRGSIWSMPDSGGKPKRVAEKQEHPLAIVADGGDLYWTSMQGDKTMRVPKAGGNVVEASECSGWTLTVDATRYLCTHKGIEVYDRATGKMLRFVDLGMSGLRSIDHVAQDGDWLFFTTAHGGTVERFRKDLDEAPGKLAESSSADAIAVDRTHVYWTDRRGREVLRITQAGGTPIVLARLEQEPLALAVDGEHVYWTTQIVTPY